jgi:hypothetical protein
MMHDPHLNSKNKNWASAYKDAQGHQRDGSVAYGTVTPDKEIKLKDSGERDVYETGAQRDNGEMKGRFDLVTPQGELRLARHYELGAEKYADRNWEKGMPIGRMVSAAMRHLSKYKA